MLTVPVLVRRCPRRRSPRCSAGAVSSWARVPVVCRCVALASVEGGGGGAKYKETKKRGALKLLRAQVLSISVGSAALDTLVSFVFLPPARPPIFPPFLTPHSRFLSRVPVLSSSRSLSLTPTHPLLGTLSGGWG
jgi:hypothetical protein